MKKRFFAWMLIAAMAVSLLAGCRAVEDTLESAETVAGDMIGTAGDVLQDAAAPTAVPETVSAPAAETAPALTREEAEAIALAHAGFSADQVKNLHTEYEVDRGVPHYDVEFDEGYWEYDYEIHAETGEILSFEKDD